MMTREDDIKFFRDQGFNPFPIRKWDKEEEQQKKADYRYKGTNTLPNQPISQDENYGVIPLPGAGTAIVDFDHLKYEPKLLEIAKKFMVIKSPHGYHLPVKGLGGICKKGELYDYAIQTTKIVEVQGPDHYVMGVGSEIYDKEDGDKIVTYKNIGTTKILDNEGLHFEDFLDKVCRLFGVRSKKRNSRSSAQNFRERFAEKKLPTKGTSNDYFFQAALLCNTEGLSQEDAIIRIKKIYDKWTESPDFSSRPWSNIEAKVHDVYSNNLIAKEGRPEGHKDDKVDRARIAWDFTESRKLYSDVNSGEIFEDKGGYIVMINNTIKRDLLSIYREISEGDYKDILFKLSGLCQDPPPTNKDLIVFKNGVFSRSTSQMMETEDLADMGFLDYNYLEPGPENEPKEFLKILFSNIPDIEIPRVKAGLKAIISPYLDPKISVIQGESRVGKSTALAILHNVLGEYSMITEMEQLLSDRSIKANIKGKRLIVLQDLPQTWKDFSQMKSLTGEQWKTEREIYKSSSTFENKIKVWASANYLAKIPEKEKAPMYARLSLIHNTRTTPYPEDPTLIERIVSSEGEKILSWIVNIPTEECIYDTPFEVRRGWESLASPEADFIETNFEIIDDESHVQVMKVVKLFEEKYQISMSMKTMIKTLEEYGYVVKYNMIKNCRQLVIPEKETNSTL